MNHRIPDSACEFGTLESDESSASNNTFTTHDTEFTTGDENAVIHSRLFQKASIEKLLVTLIITSIATSTLSTSYPFFLKKNGVTLETSSTSSTPCGVVILQYLDESADVDPTYTVNYGVTALPNEQFDYSSIVLIANPVS